MDEETITPIKIHVYGKHWNFFRLGLHIPTMMKAIVEVHQETCPCTCGRHVFCDLSK